MLENEINQKISNDRFQNSKYIVDQSNIERLSFGNKNNNFKTSTYMPNYENQISSQKFSNPVNPHNFYTINDFYNKKQIYNKYTPYIANNSNNYNEMDSFNNYNNNSICNNINGYDGRSYNTRTISIIDQSPIHMNERNNCMNFSQDITPKYYQKNNSNIIYNNSSHIGNRYSTDGGESYLNYNRDSNCNTQNHYQGISIIYPREDKLNTCESNDEQLIIYPEEKNKFENEKYFDSNTSEGILKAKNLEVYTVNSIEYIPQQKHKYKGISLGDYILKKENKYKIRKTKSCSCLNSSRDREINEYEIKVFKGKKNKERKNASCDEYNIRTIKNKMNFNKFSTEIPRGRDGKKILKLLEHFKNEKLYDDNIKPETNVEKGGIVYFKKNSFSRKYNSNYIINKNNFKLIQYPKWKIVSSACLIQSWWRSLKSLYNNYLQKIIIIQKVYRTHYYKTRYLSSMSLYEENQYQNYIKQEFDKRKNIIYGQKGQTQNINYKKYPLNGGDIIISRDLNQYNMNKEINRNNKYATKYHLNKCISRNNNNLRKESSSMNKFSSFNFSCYNINFNRFNIGMLLLKKIIENNLLKTYQIFILKLSNKNKGKESQIKTNKTDIKSNYRYLSILINNIFSNILKNKKAIFYNKLYNNSQNKNTNLYNEHKNNNNNEFNKITYQKNGKRIINVNEDIKKEIYIYEKKTNNNLINDYNNIKSKENIFDTNNISIINNSSFSFCKNNKTKDKNIFDNKEIDNEITSENNINKNEQLNKFNSDKLLMYNFSITFIGFGLDKKNYINKNKNIMTNNKIEKEDELLISKNMNITNIPFLHSFNLNNISKCNIISFSYIRTSDNLLKNSQKEEMNNKIKTKINAYNEENIILNKNIDENSIKVNEFNIEEDHHIHRNDKNNIQMNYNKSNTQEKSTNTDISNNFNINIISKQKRLSKAKENKNNKKEIIDRNNKDNDNKDKNNINNNSSPENFKLNFINHTTYSKDSISIVEKNKEHCYVKLNEKYQNLFNPIRDNLISIQNLLLRIIFWRHWQNQAFLIKNAKRAHKKYKNIESKTISKSNSSGNSNKNIISESKKSEFTRHILLLNLMQYVMDKIRKEIKRRKLIICYKDINTLKYPNLKFAFKKIKKFAKVRFKVMNEYASLIQNAFRYYLENKNKENEQDEINNNQYNNDEK